MSRDASIELVWGDGEHRFRLAIGEMRELEEKRKAGPVQIAERLTGLYDMFGNRTVTPSWRVDDIRETIRLGLIGGGMPVHDAVALVDGYMDRWPLLRSAGVAAQILDAALSGHPDEPVGKDQAGEEPTAETEAAPSASPASTETGAPSGTRRKKSTA